MTREARSHTIATLARLIRGDDQRKLSYKARRDGQRDRIVGIAANVCVDDQRRIVKRSRSHLAIARCSAWTRGASRALLSRCLPSRREHFRVQLSQSSSQMSAAAAPACYECFPHPCAKGLVPMQSRVRETVASTAHLTAAMRALGRVADGDAANTDYLADQFLLPSQRWMVRAPRLTRFMLERVMPGGYGYFNAPSSSL